MAQIKYVDQNGLKKVQEDYKAKIEEAIKDFIKNVTVQGQAAVVAEGTATVDLTSVLAEYAKTTDLEELKTGIELKGTCLKEDLATKKEEAVKGNFWIVTDDDNHFYMFVGEGQEQAENGFIDLGGHLNKISLDEYLKTATADETYVKIATGVTQLKAQLDAAYLPKEGAAEALQAELDEVYCKVADGYVKTETADETYCKAADGYAKTADFVALSDTEIEEALGISA